MSAALLELLARPSLELLERIRVAVLTSGADGRITHVNSEFCRTFRTCAERVVGLHAAEQLHDCERVSFFEHWAAWERGVPRLMRIELADGAGASRLYLVVPSPILDAKGHFRGVLVALFPSGGATSSIERKPSGLALLARSVLRGMADELEEALRRSEPELEALRSRVPALAALSEREWAVAKRIARGDRSSMIAAELRVAAGTVRNHLKSIFRKTRTGSQSALMERFQRWRADASVCAPSDDTRA